MSFDWTTFALEILNFLVLVWILKRFLYRPVLEALDARRQRIQDEMERASATLAEAHALRAQYESRLEAWEQERDQERRKLDEEIAHMRAASMNNLKRTLADEEAKAHARAVMQESVREAALKRQAQDTAYGDAAAMLQRMASPALTQEIAQLFRIDLTALAESERDILRNAAAALAPGSRIAVTSAHLLADDERTAVAQALSLAAGQPLELTFQIDPSLIAGLDVTLGECQLHANLADELAFFRKSANHAA